MNKFGFLCCTLILLSLFDLVVSRLILDPHLSEANPVMKYVWTNYGYEYVAAYKIASVVFCITVLAIASRSRPRLALWSMVALNGAVFMACAGLILYSIIFTFTIYNPYKVGLHGNGVISGQSLLEDTTND